MMERAGDIQPNHADTTGGKNPRRCFDGLDRAGKNHLARAIVVGCCHFGKRAIRGQQPHYLLAGIHGRNHGAGKRLPRVVHCTATQRHQSVHRIRCNSASPSQGWEFTQTVPTGGPTVHTKPFQ